MKKTLICGVASLLMAATPVVGVFATEPELNGGSGSAQKDVTVGTVDETVYSVDINWGDMTFDWKYNADTNSFNFEPHKKCMPIINSASTIQVLTDLQNQGKLYNDLTSCETLATTPLNAEYYAYLVPDGSVSVEDSTVNGKVKAGLSFTASSGYEWVTGKVGHWVLAQSSQGAPRKDMFIEYTDDYLPMSDSVAYGNLVLEKTTEPTSPEAITTEDKIGTVTITIVPDTD